MPVFTGETTVQLLVNVDDLAGDETGYAPFAGAIHAQNDNGDGVKLKHVAQWLQVPLAEVLHLAQRAFDDGYIELI